VVPFLLLPARHRKTALVASALPALLFPAAIVGAHMVPGGLPILPGTVAINAAAAAAALLLSGFAFHRAMGSTEVALAAEQARSERLLLNVLPASIAERLKERPGTIADTHDDVTALFADLVGFTVLSSRLSASELVELLNEVFSDFDRILESHGLQRIKTLGDGYMVVAGVPQAREDHAVVLCEVALELRDYMAKRPADPPLQVRLGLNTGPVVAGVVGTSRFQYDVWGDAINVAARMESSGVPGRVQVSETTWERVREDFLSEPRGTIEVKGKGPMKTWFLERRAR
jgi:adenylate cyclase